MLEFPKDFFWGAATSAYQVEGNNSNCDWWEWEKRSGLKEVSGSACRHYEFYSQDFDLARGLGHNAHRLSVEWSRVEPQEGKFLEHELQHYRDVILALRGRGLEPIVTLHHFTNPIWFQNIGGWQNRNAHKFFLRYVGEIVQALGDKVTYWVTINEPLVYAYHAYLLGAWPPQESSFLKAKIVEDNLAFAHIRAYELIHSIYTKKKLSSPCVSIAKNIQAFMPCRASPKNKLITSLRNYYFNLQFLDGLIKHKALDFIGINYYTRELVDLKTWRLRRMLLDVCKEHKTLKKNSLGWEIYPEGLYQLLLKLKDYNLPLFILENGVCTDDEALRWDFIYEHLKNVHKAMRQGARVLGYLYWSLLDNFEWDKGFGPHFGLIKVDYNTHERIVKEGANKYALVCRTGRLE